MYSKITYVIAFIILFTLFPRATLGQSIAGTFSGVVKDQAGPVPDADVRITNLATGQVRSASTDRQGRYELLEVPPGQYEFRVSKNGYNVVRTTRPQGLQLGLAQVARVSDITLNVAPPGDGIIEERALDVAMTDSDRPTLGTAFVGQQLRELPLSAKDVNNLAVLAPGAVSVSSFSFVNTLVPFSVNGSRGRDSNFIIDSVDNNEPLFGGAATQFSNSEIFSEFRILTGQFEAEYGRNSGSIVNVITRQGGKQLHGSLFWYGQNDGLNAITKVEKESQLTKPARFYENQLGASVGGPFKKNSTRYFVSYQWDRARNDLSSEYPVVATLPTSAGLSMLQTMNSLNPTPTLTAFLADPTVSSLPKRTTPCGSLPNANFTLPIVNPCTTSPAGGVQVNGQTIPFGTYVVPRANVFDLRDHQGSARIDQKIGLRENLFFRYLLDDLRTPLGVVSDPSEIAFSDLGILPQWRTILAARTQNFGSAWTHAFDAALNEVRFSFSRISSERGPLDADPRSRELPAVTIVDADGPNDHLNGLFASSPSAGFPAAGKFISFGSDTRSTRVNNSLFQLQENLSSVHGIHSLKFGANLIETRSNLRQTNRDLGRYFYLSFEEFVNNNALGGYQRFGNLGGKGGETLPLREFDFFYFAEDDMKLSSRFTLNLGIRYENYGQAYNRVVDLSASNQDGPPRLGRVNTNFAPRLGFAWEVVKDTVLRGGYGIYYDPAFLNIALLVWQSGSISPYVYTFGTNLSPNPSTSNSFPSPPFNPSDAYGNFLNNRFCSGITTGVTPTFLDCTNENTVSKNLRNPFVHNASLSLQHQIGKDFSLEAAYFGSRGTRLFQRLDLNPYGGWQIVSSPQSTGIGCLFDDPGRPCAFLRPRIQQDRGAIIEMSNSAFSNYHALQLSATKRLRGTGFWNGLVLTGAYTWSHMTDNASEVFGPEVVRVFAPGPNFGNDLFDFSEPFETSTPFSQDASDTRNGEKGTSSFDRRHRLVLSTVWELPPLGPKNARILLGNWELNAVISAQSGQPFTPINSLVSVPGGSFSTFGATRGGFPLFCGDVGGDGIVFNDRPNIGNPGAPVNTVAILNNFYCFDPTNSIVKTYFMNNPNVPFKMRPGCGDYITPEGNCVDPKMVRFVQIPIGGGPGNAGRNILTGPNTLNFDLSVCKSFHFGERLGVQLRAEAYDLLNRENPGPFAGNPYIASAQKLPALAVYPTFGIGPDCFLFPGSSACSPTNTFARTNGLTLENAIDSTDAGTGKSLFLSRKFLTTSSRRLQLSLKFTF